MRLRRSVQTSRFGASKAARLGGGAVRFGPVATHEQTNYPLTLVAVTGRELSLGISYDRASFDATAISGLSAQLQSLLTQFLADASLPLGDLQLLAEPLFYQP